jgi:hypothetical protein
VPADCHNAVASHASTVKNCDGCHGVERTLRSLRVENGGRQSMKMRVLWSLLAAVLLSSTSFAGDLGYDPSADPFAQYQDAVTEAAAENKLVLVIAGGDWCRWCHVLNRFVSANDEVETQLNDTFVVMKVYVGPGNYNELFFSQLPQAYGAPHFWIVSPDREVLASQSTAKLERGTSTYDKTRFLAFIDEWRKTLVEPHRQAAAPNDAANTQF